MELKTLLKSNMEIKKQNIKAFGLLESIVAIGIFGVTIVVGLDVYKRQTLPS